MLIKKHHRKQGWKSVQALCLYPCKRHLCLRLTSTLEVLKGRASTASEAINDSAYLLL